MELTANYLNQVSDVFFDIRFWLPSNYSWDQFINNDDHIYIAQPRDLINVIPTTIAMFIIRMLFEKYIAQPYGAYSGISNSVPVKASSNPELERYYCSSNYVVDNTLKKLCKQTDLNERSIQRWFRRRRNQDRPTVMKKFTETAWRLFYYVSIFTYGLIVLWDKPWFTDTKQCWTDFPRQHNTSGMYWYYMIELGFYGSLLFSQFTDVRRKDFWEQFIHHIATISLMCFSWMLNLTRMGTLVLCLHDCADWYLEGAKLNRYLNNTKLCDIMFGMFTLVWFITRIVMYPLFLIYSTSVDAYEMVGGCPSLFLFNGLLVILQLLHIIWFYIILKTAYKAVAVGVVEKDARSASEESGSDSSGEKTRANGANGHTNNH